MALVRCPIHKIPYNDENPRGCPACALEKEGGGEAQVMQELARAVQGPRRTTGTQAPPTEPVEPPRRSTGTRPAPDGSRRSSTSQPVVPEPASLPVTPPPRIPIPRPSSINAITEAVTGARLLTGG